MRDDPASYLPLAPATLHILLALAGEDLHGYGIMQEVHRQSEGRYKLGPGTLYDNIQRLTSQGLVQEVARRTAAERSGNDDPRRRYYRLTSAGRSVLSEEISRLETVVREGKLRMQSAKPRRA
jgi:DNA-binding PadR family transcriptional regulator